MMKKVFLDTNILIDYLARRGQFYFSLFSPFYILYETA